MAARVHAEGQTVDEVAFALGISGRSRSAIEIRPLFGDYGQQPEAGCIVDARRMGERVQRQFSNAKEAAAYVESLLLNHDRAAAEHLAERREAAKKLAQQARIRAKIKKLEEGL